MRKAMTITYEVDNGLYINLTNRCTNRCDFCIRNNADGAYGSDSLWLEHEPTEAEVLAAIDARELDKYSEVVFCGYGEPTERLQLLLLVARRIKESHPSLTLRVNTNGHSDLINGRCTASEFEGVIDVVSISLNTSNSEKYVAMCHPVYREKAFSALLSFAKDVSKYVKKTLFSVVRQFLSEGELEECSRIAEECGVSLRIRDYISADDNG